MHRGWMWIFLQPCHEPYKNLAAPTWLQKEKNGVTRMVCCNFDVTDKYQLLFIETAKKSASIQKVAAT